jgi:hypothetical protein
MHDLEIQEKFDETGKKIQEILQDSKLPALVVGKILVLLVVNFFKIYKCPPKEFARQMLTNYIEGMKEDEELL